MAIVMEEVNESMGEGSYLSHLIMFHVTKCGQIFLLPALFPQCLHAHKQMAYNSKAVTLSIHEAITKADVSHRP